ncbi:MAG: YidC/Oxa1 family membrane protein insertase [Phytoplasma sp.]|uniref:YidC/Oxa1 family membrane protein insertase n=1 Tax=Phytoplasma sp. TaxID=2155 RepID=UPI002B414610|nr:YidC/Oxa1 family membrane protein insertase [Phytoplasma sp.]WRH06585.1 MAG: YidC/Oxa1 family membrane protein insertase [Phytoplasma sp.]
MNNIKNTNEKLFQKFLLIFVLVVLVYFLIKKFGPNEVVLNEREELKIIFNKDKFDDNKIDNKIDEENVFNFLKEKDAEIFDSKIDKKSKSIIFEHLDISKPIDVELKKKITEEINLILEGNKIYYYYLDKDKSNFKKDFKSKIKEFFTIKVGSNIEYFLEKYKQGNIEKNFLIKLGIIKNNKIEPLNELSILSDQKVDITTSSSSIYNRIIRARKNEDNINNYFYLKYNNDDSLKLKIFVDDSGDLPIQWPNKKEWNFFLGWGYIWNVLIVLIGSFLDFFSNIFIISGSKGVFFGNLGLGIILTTLLIRTLSWPIYTKASTFSMNMSLAQPEINKIQEKYILKKDKEDIQRMQIEIFKVYRKHNFSVFSIFISFLQMPILIAMYRALNRFRIPGGIFNAKYHQPFLGFIELDLFSPSFNETFQIIIRIFLSLIVAVTMFFLNKNNFKKPSYLKNNSYNLSIEQKLKQKNQEKTMKIVSYVTIVFMFITSCKDSLLSLYWITGNIYTLFQIKINLKMMEKKYNSLKQNNL